MFVGYIYQGYKFCAKSSFWFVAMTTERLKCWQAFNSCSLRWASVAHGSRICAFRPKQFFFTIHQTLLQIDIVTELWQLSLSKQNLLGKYSANCDFLIRPKTVWTIQRDSADCDNKLYCKRLANAIAIYCVQN